VPAMIPCGSELSPPLLRRPLTIVMCERNGSSGFRIGEALKSGPSPPATTRFMIAPCGKYTKPSAEGLRGGLRQRGAAGIIASSSGSETRDAEAAQHRAARECFFVMNMGFDLGLFSWFAACLITGASAASTGTRLFWNASLITMFMTSVENLYSSFADLRTMSRTTGMSCAFDRPGRCA
jgi:hypothetical protein